jgi:nucleoside-diphosphate-sugar epimerase
MAKIFLTGITGFLGSNIAEFLIGQGHAVTAIYRPGSSRDLCNEYIEKVAWILLDENDQWIKSVLETRPTVIVHSAWIGVGHQERNDWDRQYLNVAFLEKLLFIAGELCIDKFVGLGSQAEYGMFNGCINEEYPLNAVEAYGCVKIICAEIIRQYCGYHKIDWYWLRLFSLFGKGESEKWLIPSLIKKIILNEQMDLTGGEQKYSYLYVKDLGFAINNMMAKHGKSGIYNISGKKPTTLKCLIERIRDIMDPSFELNFGKLPYRANQSMHMQGDSFKFIEAFGEFEISDFDSAIVETIKLLKKNLEIKK